MRQYIGPGFVPGVPARDLTEEEWDEHVRARRIIEGAPSSELWEKKDGTPKAAAPGAAPGAAPAAPTVPATTKKGGEA